MFLHYVLFIFISDDDDIRFILIFLQVYSYFPTNIILRYEYFNKLM